MSNVLQFPEKMKKVVVEQKFVPITETIRKSYSYKLTVLVTLIAVGVLLYLAIKLL